MAAKSMIMGGLAVGVYLYFFYVINYSFMFLANMGIRGNEMIAKVFPSTIDENEPKFVIESMPPMIWNTFWIILFGVQHMIMARTWFKRLITKVIIPEDIERTSFVFFATLIMHGMIEFWEPIREPILWDQRGHFLGTIIEVIYWIGVIFVFLSTFLISHFELFGVTQAIYGVNNTKPKLTKRAFYAYVRHPLMSGFLIAFWSTPIMTAGHLLFAFTMSVYIVISVFFLEEPNLVAIFGDEYKEYQKHTGAFCPIFFNSSSSPHNMKSKVK